MVLGPLCKHSRVGERGRFRDRGFMKYEMLQMRFGWAGRISGMAGCRRSVCTGAAVWQQLPMATERSNGASASAGHLITTTDGCSGPIIRIAIVERLGFVCQPWRKCY